MNPVFLIRALVVVGTALGAGLIALGRYGDKTGAGDTGDLRHYVVKYRTAEDRDFVVYGERADQPRAAHKTMNEAISVARTISAAPPCEARVFNLRTGTEIKF